LRILSAIPEGSDLGPTIEVIQKHIFTPVLLFSIDEYLKSLRAFESPAVQLEVFKKLFIDDSAFTLGTSKVGDFVVRMDGFPEQLVRLLLNRVQFEKMSLAEIDTILHSGSSIASAPWLLVQMFADLRKSQDPWVSKRSAAVALFKIMKDAPLEKFESIVGEDGQVALDDIVNEALAGETLAPVEEAYLKAHVHEWGSTEDYFLRRHAIQRLAKMFGFDVVATVPFGSPTYADILKNREELHSLTKAEANEFARVVAQASSADWFERMGLLSDIATGVGGSVALAMGDVVMPANFAETQSIDGVKARIQHGVFDFEMPIYAKTLAVADLPWLERRELMAQLVSGRPQGEKALQVFFEALPENAITMGDIHALPSTNIPAFEVRAYLKIVAADPSPWLDRIALAESLIARAPVSARAAFHQEFFNLAVEKAPPTLAELQVRVQEAKSLWIEEAAYYVRMMGEDTSLPLTDKVAQIIAMNARLAPLDREAVVRNFFDGIRKDSLSLSDIESCLVGNPQMDEAVAEILVGALADASGSWDQRRTLFNQLCEKTSSLKCAGLKNRFYDNMGTFVDSRSATDFLALNPTLSAPEALGYAKIILPTLKTEAEMTTVSNHLIGLVASAERPAVAEHIRQQLESALGPEEAGLRKIERAIAGGMNARDVLVALLTDTPDPFLRSLSPMGILRLMRPLSTLSSVALADVQSKKPERLVLELRDRGRAKTGGEWTAIDLMLMGVDANLAAMYRLLRLARPVGGFDAGLAVEANMLMNRTIAASPLHDMTTADFAEFHRLGRKLKTPAEKRGLTRQSVVDLLKDEFTRVFGVAAQ
jgi:hypothetical protein